MKPYASDLSDERWALIEPMLTAWRTAHPSVSGHQGRYGLCEIVNALLQQSRTGCQRNLLPHDLPPRRAVFYRYAGGVRMARTRPSTTCRAFRCGRMKGRSADPSLVVLDTQSVRTATTTGKDAAKQMPGHGHPAAPFVPPRSIWPGRTCSRSKPSPGTHQGGLDRGPATRRLEGLRR
ncbi:transposase [Nonomuraea sp. NPDC059022]|uniref:transposase n=1 Tax=Nonomuraea sp. NPDC059022 TaxID=3346705 RepID=UPI0036AF46D5